MAADARAISRHVSDARLRIVPVGVGSAYAAPGEAQSCYLVSAAGRSVAIDLGSGTLNLLQRQIAPEDLDAVVITHLHPDHCVDLMALRVYMVWGPGAGRVLPVHGPPGLRDRLVAFSGSDGWDSRVRLPRTSPPAVGRSRLGDGLRLRHREVPHLPPTHAVRAGARGPLDRLLGRLRPQRRARRAGGRVRGAGVRGLLRRRRRARGRAAPHRARRRRHRRRGRARAACCWCTARPSSTATPPSRPRASASAGPWRGRARGRRWPRELAAQPPPPGGAARDGDRRRAQPAAAGPRPRLRAAPAAGAGLVRRVDPRRASS